MKKIKNNAFKRIIKYMLKYKILYLVVIVCIIINSIIQVSTSLFLKVLIDDFITPLINNPVPDFMPFFYFIVFMGVIYLAGVITIYIYNRLMIVISQNILKNIRDDLFCSLEELPISFFDKNSYGDIMSRFTNDIDTLEEMINSSIPSLIGSFISLITIFISMVILNLYLTLLVIIGIFLMIIITKNIVKKSSENFVKQQKDIGILNGYIEEMIEGIKDVKVFNHEKISISEFEKLNENLYYSSSNAKIFGNMIGPVTNNIGHIIYVIIALFGGLLAISSNAFTLGGIAAFLTLTNSFTRPIMQITFQFNSIVRALAGAGRVFEIMDEVPEENNGTIRLVNVKIVNNKLIETKKKTGKWAWKNKNNLTLLQGDIRLNDVYFSYEKGKRIIKNMSIYAKPGQKIALVGETGAGKTTITNLLNRFYDVDKGEITYDGINIKDINKKDLRLSLGMVLQDTHLFTGTIYDNIRFGNPNASKEECIKAAKIANADSFIKLLPEGYNTKISGNNNLLSEGQKQLLAIARCALVNPPVMILDEATSKVDTRTEHIIQDGMDKLMNNRTVFVIAHRLSTIENAKAIMVMDNGCIIERGNHNDLLKIKGKYYEFYNGLLELK